MASTILISPFPAANHYTDVKKAVDFLHAWTDLDVALVTWDDWNPSLV